DCCVAMNSGWAKHLGDVARFTGKDAAGVFHFPGFSPDAAEWLMRERRVQGIAVDTFSLDHGPSKDFKTHYLWLPSGRWGLENVANLDRVPASGATLGVGVAKVKDAAGGPARVVAWICGRSSESTNPWPRRGQGSGTHRTRSINSNCRP